MAGEEPNAGAGETYDSGVMLIVCGAHLRAEVADRPLAYQLQVRIGEWFQANQSALNHAVLPVVCSDIWYLNTPALHARPVISLGGPGVNALSAFFADKLDPVLVREDRMIIQLDAEFVDLRACVWGMDHELTVAALQLFMDKYLDDFLRAVATQVEPSED